MNVINSKAKEVFFSVIPIVVLVLFLSITIVDIEKVLIIRFMISSFFVVLGLTVFLIGVDIGISPLGSLTGLSIAKTNKLWIVVLSGIVLGFFISVAEPGLLVLSAQVSDITLGNVSTFSILVTVSIGLAIMLSLGFIRIFYNIPLYKILFFLYTIIFILAIFVSREFLAISFDASGATTGVLAVPFILSLSVGISKLKKDSKASEKDSFGLVAIASTGAIISVIILDLFSNNTEFAKTLDAKILENASVMGAFFDNILPTLKESFLSILPLLIIFLVLNFFSFKLNKRDRKKIIAGFIFVFLGLFIFLIGVNTGFMDVGRTIGEELVTMESKNYIIGLSFLLGIVTILAEPAVHVLTHNIEEVTSGYIKRKSVLITLSIGVGLAVMLSVIRVLVPAIQLWHYILPGYLICLLLTFFTPKLFVGIAFDAGGVATGPVTATFILAFIQGAANAFETADLMVDGFGMIAMVAMMPIISLEVLGYIYKLKTKKKEEV